MALERFTNKDEIIETNGPVRGMIWNEDDVPMLKLDTKNISPDDRPIVELHLYTVGKLDESNYITGGQIDDFEWDKDTIQINFGKAVESLGVQRGKFEVVVNVHKNLLGEEEEPGLYIKEISDDRRELWIKALPDADLDIDSYLEAFGQNSYTDKVFETRVNPKTGEQETVLDENGVPIVQEVVEKPLSDDVALNFGENKVYKIINQKDWEDKNDFVVRLYEPLPDDINEKTQAWVVEQLSDSIIDNIDLSGPGAEEFEPTILQGPNFELDPSYGTITETDFNTWNQLLDANLTTSQQIVDAMFSGSLAGVDIGIDYSNFENFIHFSSAQERLANFKYKVELIEYYDSRLAILNSAAGGDTTALQGNVTVTRAKKNDVIGSFDGFEKWMYYEPTSSLFTHMDVYDWDDHKKGLYRAEGGFLGADGYRLRTWPKYLSGSKYHLHHSTSSIAEEYYTGFNASASLYDSMNNNSLIHTIPEHIRIDKNNEQYELFVNMIAHHFDIVYSYIENLTRVYKPEEQPKLGQSRETLYQIAKSLGWTLSNGKQASALWQYKVGVASGSGAYAQTGTLFSKSDEEITTEVWRRIVNNLPYLLKTKGTTRSIKALMNTYGIPQTLLSIREYGGPKVSGDVPAIVEDRFNYALHFTSGSETNKSSTVEFIRSHYSSSIGSWGIQGANDSFTLPSGIDESQIYERPPDTIEFRVKPAITQSMNILSHKPPNTANVHWNLGIQHTGSFSGSGKYGRLFFQLRTLGGGEQEGGPGATANPTSWVPNAGNKYAAFSDYVPIYDGEFWNVRLWTEFPFVTASHDTPTVPRIYFQTQKSSDYITGKIVHTTSGSFKPGSGSNSSNAQGLVKYWANPAENKSMVIGGETGSGLIGSSAVLGTGFSGSIQEYREWMEVLDQKTFDLHTMNPTSYVSSLSPTSSYDTLVRHYPFGTDLNAVDHSTGTGLFITSSHPNQNIKDFSPPFSDGHSTYATMSQFPTPINVQRGNYRPVEETYYIQGISLGGNLPRSQKIRLEDNELIRQLSPTNTSEKSRFDRAPIDTNRLGLFYSHADQINKEIFNHIGDVELDDYVGDPDDEFEFNYPDLEYFSKEYWKKYSDRNDINSFIKIFSQFDYGLFEQIKQLLPERVDEAMGVLVEPHALERAKARLSKRPVKEPLHYDAHIIESAPTASGTTPFYDGTIERRVLQLFGTSIYHPSASGKGGYNEFGNYVGSITASVPQGPYTPTDYFNNKQIFAAELAPSRTGSMLFAYTRMNDKSTVNKNAGDGRTAWNNMQGAHVLRISQSFASDFLNPGLSSDQICCQFDTYNQQDTIRDFDFDVTHRNAHLSVGSGLKSITASLLTAELITTINNDHGEHKSNVTGSRLIVNSGSFGDVRINKTLAEDRVMFAFSSSGMNTQRFSFREIHIEPRTNVTLRFQYKPSKDNLIAQVNEVQMIQTIKKVGHSAHQTQIYEKRKSDIFNRVINHYGTGSRTTKLGKDHERSISQSLQLAFSQSLTPADYMDDFFQMTLNQRYDGCKLTGPAINQPSTIAAIDKKPVIEVFSVNPNQLVYTDQPSEGTPGNLIVR
jgi:hypothetical protein